jgi:hypothetical protein
MAARVPFAPLTAGFLAAATALLAGCGGHASHPLALPAGARPIGVGPRFAPSAPARPVRACRSRLGRRYGAHIELFAQDRVILVPAGIGVGRPLGSDGGRIVHARCYGPLVSLDPTGTVLVRAGTRPTVGALFDQWGAALRPARLLSFAARAPSGVRAYVDGARWTGDPRRIPLARHREIVLEVGPFVPPHRSYAFPRGL